MKYNKHGFTLVELLAVIVILAIILVIAVPKVMSVIEDAKKATLESTAKMIASAAEKAKVQNTVLSKDKEINCEDVVKLNDIDYDKCIIEFDNDNNALVTIKGSGKFANLSVCEGDKTNSVSTTETCNVEYGNAGVYISKLQAFKGNENKLENPKVEYEGITHDTGIRYSGSLDEVKNKVYYNCDDKDSNNIIYGEEDYDYASGCEVWRIIGVFDVSNGNSNEKRMKLINTESTFIASWDSSKTDLNGGAGINQWGESVYENGSFYEGSDIMKLLNGYYIGKENAECKYCNDKEQEECIQICDAENDKLKEKNIKPLTSTAKEMIENAVWDTHAVKWPEDEITDIRFASTAYLEEKGISNKYNGKILCESFNTSVCNDKVERTTSWTGLVGLMSVSDITYANGWLYMKKNYSWTITPRASNDYAYIMWTNAKGKTGGTRGYNLYEIWPTVYLKSNIKIIGGDGNTTPYKLSL